LPWVSILRLENPASPATAFFVMVALSPVRVAPAVPVLRAIDMGAIDEVTRWFAPSSTSTWTDVPPVVLNGVDAIAVLISASAGSLKKWRWHPPAPPTLTATLLFAVSRVKSLPGGPL